MSGTSNRFHEEGNRKRPLEESALLTNPRKLIRPLDNNFRLPSESGQDGHLSNTQRIDPLDADRRSPLLHQRISSPSNYLDPLDTVGNRSEFKSTKDSTVKAETRETIRELYAGSRIDHKGIRIDQNARLDMKRDEKEIRSARSPHNYFTGDVKFGKDGHVAANSRSCSTEAKGYSTDQRYPEPSTKGLDPCCVAGLDLVTANEVTRNPSTTEERNSFASYAAVGEDRVETNREKHMKKEGNHEDVGQRNEDKNDHTNSPQVGGVSKDYHGLQQEETQQCERERYITQNDKGHYDKKDCKQYVSAKTNEEALLDGSEKTTDRDIIELQQQEKDDSCRVSDKDIKDKGRETYVDVEVKHESNGTCYNKESGDRCAAGGIRRNENAFGSDVQQQRTMLQSLETPQGPLQLSGVQSNAGSQGKNEATPVVYKPGSCTPELLKSWREFEASQDKKNDERYQGGPILKIQIPGEYVTATNPQVKGAQLWGKDIYTDDSDIVAVLMHIGYCCRTTSPTRAIQELHATVTLLPPQDWYASSLRNGIRSRAQRTCDGCSFRVEQCCIMKKDGGTINLEPRLAIEPTLAPVAGERKKRTRAAALNARRPRKSVPEVVSEVTIQYNLCNEPWQKYSISVVGDKGAEKSLYTAARLKKGEVLYLETDLHRYELCFSGERVVSNGTASTSSQSQESKRQHQSCSLHVPDCERKTKNSETMVDLFRWSRCKKPLPQKLMCSVGIPLRTEHLEVLEKDLDWEDVQWSESGVWVLGKEYVLARLHFISHTKP